MTSYRLTEQAEEDLIGIWLYSYETWGPDQADRYLDLLRACCDDIAEKQIIETPVTGIEQLWLSRCEEHIVFYTWQRAECVIVAFLHGRMDMPAHLLKRISGKW